MNSNLPELLSKFKSTITHPSFVYVGIGSCPHAKTLAEYTDSWNQILPVFVRDVLTMTKQPVRILHFDPAFGYHEERMDFVKEYFESTGLNLVYDSTTTTWSNERISIMLSDKPFNHTDQHMDAENSDDWFLEDLATHCILTDAKLIVQEFTGRDLDVVLKTAFRKSQFQKKFKNNILFDITYGTASSCQTDMAKYKPFYNTRQNFYNLLLYTPDELKKYIGLHPMVDSYIKKYFTKQYETILNNYHVDYRRRTRNETCLFKNELYTNTSEPEYIMELLEEELCALIPVFQELKVVTPEKVLVFASLFETYKTYKNNDMYKWYDLVKSIIA
jgi:hypothetical protein